jgi:hypothetical protein
MNSQVENRDIIESKYNLYIKENLNLTAEKLLDFSLNYIEKNKSINNEFNELTNLQNELKQREIKNSNKKKELFLLEKRLKEIINE